MKYALTYEDLAPQLNPNSKVFYVNGCSMTYGQELAGVSEWTSVYQSLPKSAPANFHETRLKSCFSGILHSRLFHDHVLMNDAMCGGSNYRIVRRTMHNVADMINRGVKSKNIFVLIGFTNMFRLEVFDKQSKDYIDIHFNLEYKNDKDYAKISDTYLKRFNSTQSTIQQTMTLITSLEAFLKTLGVKYLFSESINMISSLELDPEDYPSVQDNPLFNFLDGRRWVGWDHDYGMHAKLSWCHNMRNYCMHKLKLPVGPCDHPLEESHLAWAEYIEEHINTYEELFI